MIGDSAANHDVIGPGCERFAWRRNALLIIQRLIGHPDPGRNDLEASVDSLPQ